MIKITKRPKYVTVERIITQGYYLRYRCPSCQVEFSGALRGDNTTRFVCECGQELIIKKLFTSKG